MKELWDHKESIKTNLEKMGVAFDANKVVAEKTTKQLLVEKALKSEEELVKNSEVKSSTKCQVSEDVKSEVIKRLESEALKAEQSKVSKFRFTKEQVKWITYCLDKHGDDFKAMARDPENVWQETPKQIRQKVLKFINIPEQFAVYAKARGFLEDAE